MHNILSITYLVEIFCFISLVQYKEGIGYYYIQLSSPYVGSSEDTIDYTKVKYSVTYVNTQKIRETKTGDCTAFLSPVMIHTITPM